MGGLDPIRRRRVRLVGSPETATMRAGAADAARRRRKTRGRLRAAAAAAG